jgi:hypothetical protein
MPLMKVTDGFWISREVGDGSSDETEDFVDGIALRENDGRSLTRTEIPYSHNEHDSSIDWDKLRKINDGMWASERKSQNRMVEIRKDAKLFFDRLELDEDEKDRGFYILDNIDYSSNNFGRRIEEIILAIATLVRDENCENISRRLNNQDIYHELLEINNTSPRVIRRIRNKIRDEYDFFDD